MALDAKKVYGALTTYVNESLIGVGALKGANCTIKSIVHQDGVNTITFEWTADDGTKRENVMQVYDGTPIYVWESGNTYHYGDLVIYESEFYRCVFENSDVTFDRYHWQEISSKDGDYDIVPTTNELPARFTSADKKMYFVYTEAQFYFWDGTAWISQTEAKQLVTMPTASATWVNRTVQFIGTTDANYTHGFFYECVEDSGYYSWVNVATTDLSGKVDKETGKGLSTNDFTNTYKNQLDGLGTSSTKDYTDTFDEDGTEVTTGKAIADAINTEGVIDTPSQIMSFADGSDSPMKSCTVSIEPVQDLHGYDRPWTGGAGKNLIPMTVDGIKAANSYTWEDDNSVTTGGTTFKILTDDGNNVTGIKVTGEALSANVLILGSLGTVTQAVTLNGSPANGSGKWKLRFDIDGYEDNGSGCEIPANTTVNRVRIAVYPEAGNANLTFLPMIRLSTDTDPTFEPYSNVCPITEHDEVTVDVVGKNLFPQGTVSGTLRQAVNVDLKPGTYAFSTVVTSDDTDSSQCVVLVRDKNDNSLAQFFVNRNTRSSQSFTIDGEAKSIMLFASSNYSNSVGDSFTYTDIQVERGSTATSYTPYNVRTYTIDLGTTVYGGTLDFVSGVLTVDRASVDLGTLTWTSNATNRYQSDSLNGVKNVVTDVSVADNLMCSAYDVSPANNTPIGGISSFTSDGTTYIRVMDDRYPSIYTFTQGVTGVQLVYELATTYTVQLTPTQVRSLLGANNVWSDSGEMEKIIYNKGTTTLSLTIADLYNIIANLDARVKELEGKDEIDLSTMSDEDLDAMLEDEESEEEMEEENE